MTAKSDAARPNAPNSLRLSIARVLIVVVLAAVIYLLGQSMVRHRFFRGGWINPNGRLMP
jgi:hypothetical protein